MGGKVKYLIRGTKGANHVSLVSDSGWPLPCPFRTHKCLPTRPGHESGARDGRGRPAILVRWLMRSGEELF